MLLRFTNNNTFTQVLNSFLILRTLETFTRMATTAGPQETASFHPWSDLPTELQLEVLGHALTFPEPIDKNTSYQAVSLLIPLLRCGNTDLAALARESCK